jgi:hypothetical protein
VGHPGHACPAFLVVAALTEQVRHPPPSGLSAWPATRSSTWSLSLLVSDDVVNRPPFEDLDEVILVGNSSAGVVITSVADRVPERIGQVVHLDAFVPTDGQSLRDTIPPERRPAMELLVETEGDGWLLPASPPHPGSSAFPRPGR